MSVTRRILSIREVRETLDEALFSYPFTHILARGNADGEMVLKRYMQASESTIVEVSYEPRSGSCMAWIQNPEKLGRLDESGPYGETTLGSWDDVSMIPNDDEMLVLLRATMDWKRG